MKNLACRIFKEQLDLLLSLPNQEEAKTVLYQAVVNSYIQTVNQFENQFDYQNENQNENVYVSVSVSVSELSKSILNLLTKSIIWKEFSNNYGGRRENAGRPPKQENQTDSNIQKIQKNQKIQKQQTETINININTKHKLPENWQPKESTIAKLKEKGVIVDKAIDKFINSCQANGYKYVDFDRALLSWDWEKNGLVEKNKVVVDDVLRAKL